MQTEGYRIAEGADTGFAVRVSKTDDSSIHPHDLYISRLSDYVQRNARVEWLDVGCGWHCDWPWALEREKLLVRAANIFGLDPDWQAIVRHRTIRKRVVGVIERLPYAGNSFDLVSANVVVEHLRRPHAAFAEVFRVLRPDGVFLFRTPSARSFFVRIARRLPQGLKRWLASRVIERRKVEDIYPAHYLANTPEIIEEICERVGFRQVSVTITRARGVFGRFPRLHRVESFLTTKLSSSEGTLLVEAQK